MTTSPPGRTVFLGGCPGSGKSFLAEALVREGGEIRHEVAGQLIRRALSQSPTAYRRPVVAGGMVADHFQQHLVEQYRRVRSAFDGPILLDGHFVIPTKEGPHPVSADVFAALNVDAFVLVETELEVVLRRLRMRPPQSWWDGDRESIASLRNLEMAQAEVIAQALARPLVRVDGETIEGLPEIRRLLKSDRTEHPPESR